MSESTTPKLPRYFKPLNQHKSIAISSGIIMFLLEIKYLKFLKKYFAVDILKISTSIETGKTAAEALIIIYVLHNFNLKLT